MDLGLDGDGYPTEAALAAVTGWAGDYAALMAAIGEIWHFGGWGWTEEPDHWRVSTGGWSGTEDLIGALARRPDWPVRLAEEWPGGHYLIRKGAG